MHTIPTVCAPFIAAFWGPQATGLGRWGGNAMSGSSDE